MHIRIILEFLKNTNVQILLFYFYFCQSSRYVSNQQPCLRTIGLYEDLFLYLACYTSFYFISSAPISFSLFSNSSINSIFFLMFFLKPLLSIVEKLLIHMYIDTIYNTYILENTNFCLTKKFMTFDSTCLT